MSKDIKESIKKLYDSKLQGTDEQYKSTQKNVNNIIKQAEFQYESKTLDKMKLRGGGKEKKHLTPLQN